MMDDPDLMRRLLDAIAAGDDDLAEAAAQACAGRPELLPALRPLLTAADTDRRWWAVRTLALIGGPEAVGLLLQRLDDPDEATRCAAALALGHLAATDAINPLVGCLADPSGWVRDSAADALTLIGERALRALTTALDDPRPGVRVARRGQPAQADGNPLPDTSRPIQAAGRPRSGHHRPLPQPQRSQPPGAPQRSRGT